MREHARASVERADLRGCGFPRIERDDNGGGGGDGASATYVDDRRAHRRLVHGQINLDHFSILCSDGKLDGITHHITHPLLQPGHGLLVLQVSTKLSRVSRCYVTVQVHSSAVHAKHQD